MTLPHSIQIPFADLALGGVLERHPRLKLVSAENDISWLPHFCYRIDHAYDRLRHFEGVNLPLKPSEYMKRQVWATFQFETSNVGFTCAEYGADKLMWSSDYPYTDSPWPRSRELIEHGSARSGKARSSRRLLVVTQLAYIALTDLIDRRQDYAPPRSVDLP
jgi:hypothetical protein